MAWTIWGYLQMAENRETVTKLFDGNYYIVEIIYS